jgi:ribosome-associated protein
MNEPLPINDSIQIPPGELLWTAARSSGPGGQNVNKVASKIELRFDVPGTHALDEATKQRLRTIARSRLDAEGWLLITSQLTRDQGRNLEDARQKLRELILRALERPTPRRPTRPTRASQERRVNQKRQRGSTKAQRSRRSDDSGE